ncbi:expressed unknown protein [Seminavis robusta]|uniref:Uncharacterized protein n=1 Tax=Seminavis robusta TaxID=568900 RepID=A0A9N8DVH3_9STRA|nr:expressed unknown protein [Seminavis robusta]|eukprot:Sro403_g135620.1 n/a (260) ;mRNA; f:21382-22161
MNDPASRPQQGAMDSQTVAHANTRSNQTMGKAGNLMSTKTTFRSNPVASVTYKRHYQHHYHQNRMIELELWESELTQQQNVLEDMTQQLDMETSKWNHAWKELHWKQNKLQSEKENHVQYKVQLQYSWNNQLLEINQRELQAAKDQLWQDQTKLCEYQSDLKANQKKLEKHQNKLQKDQKTLERARKKHLKAKQRLEDAKMEQRIKQEEPDREAQKEQSGKRKKENDPSKADRKKQKRQENAECEALNKDGDAHTKKRS